MFPHEDDMTRCALVGEANFLLRLLKNLGFLISLAKLLRPTHDCNCLGIMTDTKTLFISKENQLEIIRKCRHIQQQKYITKTSVAYLHHNVVQKCVTYFRYFRNRQLNTLREAASNEILIAEYITREITWF